MSELLGLLLFIAFIAAARWWLIAVAEFFAAVVEFVARSRRTGRHQAR